MCGFELPFAPAQLNCTIKYQVAFVAIFCPLSPKVHFVHILHTFSLFSSSAMISCHLLPDLFALAGVMVAALGALWSGAHVFLRYDWFCIGSTLFSPYC